MKQMTNPIMVNIEVNLIEDVIKILGQAIHTRFSHDEVSVVRNTLFSAGKKAVEDHQVDENDKTIQ